jgi:Arc/MetJ family transcription regulator
LVVDDETVAKHIKRMELAEEYEMYLRKARRAFRWATWAFVALALDGVLVVVALAML